MKDISAGLGDMEKGEGPIEPIDVNPCLPLVIVLRVRGDLQKSESLSERQARLDLDQVTRSRLR